MKAIWFARMVLLSVVVAVVLPLSGCVEQAGDPGGESTPIVKNSKTDPSYGGWWCVEHGVPEDECSMCSTKVAAECKALGDWCDEHNRAESHCFVCHPEKAEKFAKLYEAKVGEAPPLPDSE